MTTLTNPGPGGKYATIEGVTYGTDDPGGTVETKSALHATILVEYGFVMDPQEYAAALDAAAERARAENSSVSSASASEGKILARQATVDVESGAVTTPPEDPAHPNDPPAAVAAEDLKGDALTEALKVRGLEQTGTADEKRARVAAYDASRAGGEVVVDADDDGFVRDADGELVLDDDENPIPVSREAADADGELVLDDDENPIPVSREAADAGVTPGERAAGVVDPEAQGSTGGNTSS